MPQGLIDLNNKFNSTQMKNIITFLVLFLLSYPLFSQVDALVEVEGAITLGASSSSPALEGSIRWTGNDFEAYDGVVWRSLTSEGIIYDADSNSYNVVGVGKQLWMKENLRTSKYADGSDIIHEVIGNTWGAQTEGAYCWMFNENTYEVPNGKLYNWYAVDDPRGICPSGWRIPTESDFQELITYLTPTYGGGRLKEVGNAHWVQPNTGATNMVNMDVVPGGYRTHNGNFVGFNVFAFFWSSTSVAANTARYLQVLYDSAELETTLGNVVYGNSVRCIKD